VPSNAQGDDDFDRKNMKRELPSRVASSLSALLVAAVLAACARAPGTGPPTAAIPEPTETLAPIRVTLIQLNDIYEITPVGGGRWGGPARVATVRRELLDKNPNTYTVLAGDLFSPSALGTARVDGERLAGRQMVAVLNAMGLDYATFGNHEFDLDEGPFLSRLQESTFGWVSSNVTDAAGLPFPGVARHVILEARGSGGQVVRVGLIGLTMDAFQPDYVRIADPVEVAREEMALLGDSADVLVALTHLPVEQDIALAEAVPELDLILGGHEHENMRLFRGTDLTPILKADANVRTVYVHDLRFDAESGSLTIDSRLLPITDAIPGDPTTQAVVEGWVERGFAGFRESGFDPEDVVAEIPVSLDGLEASVRNRPTRLTALIAEAMLQEVEGADGALLNSGSIRVDDVLPPGPLTQYDVIRILPFGGPVLAVEMKGALLEDVLTQGERNQGGGGYLQLANIRRDEAGTWLVGREPLNANGTYTLAVSDFLVTGLEQGFEFLSPENPLLRILQQRRDMRLALIDELKRRYGSR
jgi:5'-nucleotidase